MQCQGTTVRGQRCKLVASGPYCRFHQNGFGRRPVSPAKIDAGFIYIYTLSKFFNKEPDFFKVRNLPGTPSKSKHKWKNYRFAKSPYALLKIGKTTKSVRQRIDQWQDQCKHDLTIVDPTNDRMIRRKSGFLSMFQQLSLRPEKYETYKENGFSCLHNLSSVESEIHRALRLRYGYGNVYCRGCLKDDVDVAKDYNIHVEWFLIPKKELSLVYELIDSVCFRNS